MKSLTKEEKIKLLDKLFNRLEELNKLVDQSSAVGFPTSPLSEAVYHIVDHAITYASELVEDPYEWVSWYVHECKMGKNKAMCNVSVDGKNHMITSTRKLVEIMILSEKK